MKLIRHTLYWLLCTIKTTGAALIDDMRSRTSDDYLCAVNLSELYRPLTITVNEDNKSDSGVSESDSFNRKDTLPPYQGPTALELLAIYSHFSLVALEEKPKSVHWPPENRIVEKVHFYVSGPEAFLEEASKQLEYEKAVISRLTRKLGKTSRINSSQKSKRAKAWPRFVVQPRFYSSIQEYREHHLKRMLISE